MDQNQKINLLDFDRHAMEAFFSEMGEKAFRTTQVMKWLYHLDIDDIELMSNLSKKLRQHLIETAEIKMPEIVTEQVSSDGTRKWLIRLGCGNCVETVFIPEADRGTLCVSSQVGCTLNCTFCSTARQGYNRNLHVHEIVSQLRIANRVLSQSSTPDARVTNVVMMGMGEPLMNFDNVVAAMNIMMDDYAFGLSKRRITLSTAGVVPALLRLREVSDVSLAISLHAPNDALRETIVPLNKKYSIAELLDACREYIKDKPHRKITFEYVMLKGVNDHKAHAHELVSLLEDMPAMVNLIPFNPFPGSQYETSTEESIQAFKNILLNAGITTVTRRTRGEDIDAACGQLAGSIQDRTRRSIKIPVIGASS